MAVDSVSSSTSAQAARPQLQAEQARPDDQARKAEEAKKAEEARQAEKARQAAQSNKERPVVNTQGQTTGKVVNVTA